MISTALNHEIATTERARQVDQQASFWYWGLMLPIAAAIFLGKYEYAVPLVVLAVGIRLAARWYKDEMGLK